MHDLPQGRRAAALGRAPRTTTASSPAPIATTRWRASRRQGLLRSASISETCQSCHAQQRAEFRKRSHMPLPEGKMSCADCHNPARLDDARRCSRPTA